jgi:hypothetical protein
VKAIDYKDDDAAKGSLITIENLEEMALPVTAFIKEENGKSGTVKLPAEIWQRGSIWTFPYKSTSKILYVTLDPDHLLPDINPDNNSMSGILIPKSTTAANVIDNYLNAVGGAAKLKGVKDLTVKATSKLQGTDLVAVTKYKTPDKESQEILAPAFNNFVVLRVNIDADSIRLVQFNKELPIRKEDKSLAKAKYQLFPELEYGKPGYKIELAPNMQVINNELAYIVTVTNPDGVRVKNYYDQKTGYKVRKLTDVPNATPTDYGNYQSISSGIKIPFTEKTNAGGYPLQLKVNEAVVNSNISNDVFK